jgi:hypothetical protein
MKNGWIIIALLLSGTLLGQQETFKENIRRELRFSDPQAENLLVIQNINGGIAVEGYSGNEIFVEVVKTIKARSTEQRQQGQEEIQLGAIEKETVIALYMQTPCSRLNPASITSEELREGWKWSWWDDCEWKPKYDYRLDYNIRVPAGASLRLSTINQGDIEVRNVEGRLKVNNVNGAITMEGIAGAADAHTINGDLTLRYDRNPAGESKYYTLNGDIKAFFRPGLSAELYFKSFNGDLFTDLDDIELMAPRLEKKEGGQGVNFKVGGTQGIRIRSGGVRLEFETFNGDVYVREEQ